MTTLLSNSACNFSRTNTSNSRDSIMFNKLRQFTSRKEKEPSRTSSIKSQNNHPQISSTPSTRRPANLPSINNPFRDMGEAPPPYSPAPSSSNASSPTSTAPTSPPSTSSQNSNRGADDPYTFLRTFDTVFLIDDSGSMAGSRWRETEAALKTITPICTNYDEDGVDIYFLNRADSDLHKEVKTSRRVEEIFSKVKPGGGTPTGQKLNSILRPYLKRYAQSPESTKPINIICITDGEPSDDVESPLIQTAKKLDKLDAPAWQVGVQFFQVGRDEEAKKHLKQLDDELAEIAGDDELRDMVDTVPFKGDEGEHLTGDGIMKVVLGAVNRRLDRKKSQDLHR